MKKSKKIILLLAIIISLVGIIYSSYNIIMWKHYVDENNKVQKEIDDNIEVIKKEDNEEEYNIDFKSLKEKNNDTIAYIKVNNTNINYVVVKTKDNKYYLKHNFEKKWNTAGWVFGDYRNKFDGTDKNLIIYGHNTKNGSMFGSLKNVLKKGWYENKDNHKIVLVTENDTYYYEVFSSYSIKPEDYYIKTEFNEKEFDKFIKELKNRSIYDYGVEVNNEDKILTLSSCINEGRKRVVLHARLMEIKGDTHG